MLTTLPPLNQMGGAVPVLTAKLISKLSCDDPKKPIFVWDDKLKGFAVCVTKTRKSFVFKGRIKQSGRSKQIKIAGCDVISVDEARERARVIAGEFSSFTYLEDLHKKQSIPILSDAFNKYVDVYLNERSPKHRKDTINIFKNWILPRLSKHMIIHIRSSDIYSITDEAKSKGKDRTASAIWGAMSTFLKWCLDRDYIENHPLAGRTPPKTPQPVKRLITLDEIKIIWEASERLTLIQQNLLKFIILTVQRNRETTTLEAHDINGDWWTLPAAKVKNSLDNHIYLTPFAKQFVPPPKNEGSYLFSANGEKPIWLGDKIKKKLNIDMPPWTYHQLRHAFDTHLNEAGMPPHIVDACIGHKTFARSGVSGIYNLAEYKDQKLQVFQKWSDMVEDMVGR